MAVSEVQCDALQAQAEKEHGPLLHCYIRIWACVRLRLENGYQASNAGHQGNDAFSIPMDEETDKSKLFGMQLAPCVTIYSGTEFRAPARIGIGANLIIGNDCLLDGRQGLTIGSSVNISSGVWMWTLHHDMQSPDFAITGDKIIVHDRVWLATKSTAHKVYYER